MNWVGVFFNGLWILGSSLVVTALSFSYAAANREHQPISRLLERSSIHFVLIIGMIFFSLGLAGSLSALWQRVLWAIFTTLLGVQAWNPLRSLFRRQ